MRLPVVASGGLRLDHLDGGAAILARGPAGIGKCTAERIIVELREKVGVDGDAASAMRVPIVARRGEPQDPRLLARDGLLELGYAPVEAEELLAGVEGETAEELLGGALRLARSTS